MILIVKTMCSLFYSESAETIFILSKLSLDKQSVNMLKQDTDKGDC